MAKKYWDVIQELFQRWGGGLDFFLYGGLTPHPPEYAIDVKLLHCKTSYDVYFFQYVLFARFLQ